MPVLKLIHEAANFDDLLDYVPDAVMAEFQDMWFNDLKDRDYETDKIFIDSANNILSYFGVCWRVLEFSYDPNLEAFVWLCQHVGLDFID